MHFFDRGMDKISAGKFLMTMKELDYRLIVLIETGNAGRLDKACLGVLSPGGA
jgi:hypothetical protein